jgi:polyphosphate kinase
LSDLRFLGIFSNNRDEFFRVRVATVKRMLKIRHEAKNIIREDPKKLLNNILLKTSKQQALFTETYQSILKELELHNIFFINEKQLTAEQGKFVREYFHEFVFPAIVPIMLDQSPAFSLA